MSEALTGADLAGRARALAGTPFRLHGRDPATGLDCVGVLAVILGKSAVLPTGYPLRARRLPPVEPLAASAGLVPASGDPLPGDVLLLRVGAVQHHVAIALGPGSIIHAHAGLRRVVISPRPAEWPIAGHWRLTPPTP